LGIQLSEQYFAPLKAIQGLQYASLSVGFASVSFSSDSNRVTIDLISNTSVTLYSFELTKDSDEESACASDEDDRKVPEWITHGGILLVIIGMIQCFWGLARVCEHYFCSALLIMCEQNRIPDDVAGATIMAIGTSAADLMISVIALFVSSSSVGLGTIIGSEIFNHLIISAACAMNSKIKLKLNHVIFTREIFSYCITLCILIVALNRGTFRPSEFDQCLTIQWYVGLILIFFYCIYATVVVYNDRIFGISHPEIEPDMRISSTVNPISQAIAIAEEQTNTRNKGSQDSEVDYKDHLERARELGIEEAQSPKRSSLSMLHDEMHNMAVSTLVEQGVGKHYYYAYFTCTVVSANKFNDTFIRCAQHHE
jgi:Ca2+/Na+ antiporter